MKNVLFLLFIFCAQIATAQTSEDYQTTIDQLKVSYNNQDASAIHNLLADSYKTSYPLQDLKTLITETQQTKGAIEDSSLLMEDETGVRFLVQFTESDSVFVLLLNGEGLLTKFEIEEY